MLDKQQGRITFVYEALAETLKGASLLYQYKIVVNRDRTDPGKQRNKITWCFQLVT